jgi:hypothetical protein
MNSGMPARPYLSPQLPMEGISSRAVNMGPKPISNLPQGSLILDEEHINPWSLNVPTYGRNHQVDAEARSLAGCGGFP